MRDRPIVMSSSGRGVCEGLESNGGGDRVFCSGRIVGAFYRPYEDGGLLIGAGKLYAVSNYVQTACLLDMGGAFYQVVDIYHSLADKECKTNVSITTT